MKFNRISDRYTPEAIENAKLKANALKKYVSSMEYLVSMGDAEINSIEKYSVDEMRGILKKIVEAIRCLQK